MEQTIKVFQRIVKNLSPSQAEIKKLERILNSVVSPAARDESEA